VQLAEKIKTEKVKIQKTKTDLELLDEFANNITETPPNKIKNLKELKKKPILEKKKNSTYLITFDMLNSGLTMKQIAIERELNITTIENHILELCKNNMFTNLDQFGFTNEIYKNMKKDYKIYKIDSVNMTLRDIYETFNKKYTYMYIKLFLFKLSQSNKNTFDIPNFYTPEKIEKIENNIKKLLNMHF
jgi:uncharacterized protein YpbB